MNYSRKRNGSTFHIFYGEGVFKMRLQFEKRRRNGSEFFEHFAINDNFLDSGKKEEKISFLAAKELDK